MYVFVSSARGLQLLAQLVLEEADHFVDMGVKGHKVWIATANRGVMSLDRAGE